MAKKPKKTEVILDDFHQEPDVDTIEPVENSLYRIALASVSVKPTEPQPIELIALPRHKSSLNLKGYDIHYHRISYLLDSGAPIAGWATIAIPSDSDELIEKQSIKVYLESYTMVRMGRTKEEAKQQFVSKVKEDVEKLLRVDTIVKLYDQPQQFFNAERFYSLDANLLPHDDFKKSSRATYDKDGETAICFHAFRAKQNGSIYIEAEDKLDTIGLYHELVGWRQNDAWHEVVADLLMEELSISKTGLAIDFGSFIALRWNHSPFAFQKLLIE